MDPILLEQKRNMYITSLLNETLPLSMITEDILEELEIDGSDTFGLLHLIFDNQLKETIESQDQQVVADWKSQLHEVFLAPIDQPQIHNKLILNLAPYTRSIFFSYQMSDLPVVEKIIDHWFEAVKEYLHATENSKVLAFVHLEPTPFTKIGKQYKDLRKLQSYQYAVGMGNLCLYNQFKSVEGYSVEEYKYIQRYEQALRDKDHNGLLATINLLYSFVKNHLIKDSKLIYIYKELMSITIRHLYSNETEHLQMIEQLNQMINNFQMNFNDLEEVHQYMVALINNLDEQTIDRKDYHPHIKKVLTFIHTNYQHDIALSDISDDLNLSVAYLSRLFHENLKIGFKAYLTKYRMNIIKDQLIHSDTSIKEIASMAGYNNPDQMTRIFKKYEKMTPREFRQERGSASI